MAHAYARVRELEERLAEHKAQVRATERLLSAARSELDGKLRGIAPDPAARADVLGCPELAQAITSHVGAGDLLAWALACKGFCAAQVELQSASNRKIRSPVVKFLSPSRAAWVAAKDQHGRHLMVPNGAEQRTFCSAAAERGDLKCLQALRSGGFEWDAGTCTKAAAGGHLEVLQWAREQGCPWDETTCTEAARCGHLEVLQWAVENGCPYTNM